MICVIPARGGSSRFPGKNIKELNGWPVIYYPITAARNAGIFDDIIVSTDDDEIADIVDAIGCNVHFRPPYLRGDVPESDVLIDVARMKMVDSLCRIYPFAALLTPERITRGYVNTISFSNPDIVMECVEYNHSPLRAMTLDGLKRAEYISPDVIPIKTQNLKKFYHDAATYFFCQVSALNKPVEERTMTCLPVSQMECQDVDYPEDFDMLKLKYRILSRNKS